MSRKLPTEGSLPPEELRWTCDPSQFPFELTSDIGKCPIRIIGQPRAMEALRLGLSVRAKGYNVFVAGEVGTGRSTTVRDRLAEVERGTQAPDDRCYVYNFEDTDQPRLLSFPAGRGRGFARAMEDLVQSLQRVLPELFDSDVFRGRRTAAAAKAKAEHKERLKRFEKEIEGGGFALVQVQAGVFVRPELMPIVAGNAVDMDQLERLVEEGKFDLAEYERIKEKHAALLSQLERLTAELRNLEQEFRKDLQQIERNLAGPPIQYTVQEVRSQFPEEGVSNYLDAVEAHLLDHLQVFRSSDGSEGDREEEPEADLSRSHKLPYAVNVLVDHSRTKGRPILWETSPSYRNLFGTVDRTQLRGEWRTDHTLVHAGSLLQASGGFLVVDAMDLLVEPGVWAALKRTLRHQMLEIRSFDPLNLFSGNALKPQPIPIDVKVVLIGTKQIYRLLYFLDEDFKKIFKVKAEFAVDSDRSPDELQNYACFVYKKCLDDDLPPFHRNAVAAVAEHGVRLSGRQEKITTRFAEIADVVREAGYWAQEAKAKRVDAKHVDRALRERDRRVNLTEEILRESISEGTVLIDLTGEKVGQVNGLAVLSTGDHAFGQPTRITAVTAMGRGGIIDIERQSKMSGPIHTKGVLILSGFLRARFAQDKPLALSASLAFEQNYGGIDGDSASSTELYAILSSLSGLAIRQGIAVTGSVNQRGEIQPIGGVNEKIEGYFDLCREKGLKGGVGVMIPDRNRQNLMLRREVVDAVRKGRFHVWAVSSIDEGIEVLTGVPAGERGSGGYPADTVYGLADARLRDLAEGVRRYGLAPREPVA